MAATAARRNVAQAEQRLADLTDQVRAAQAALEAARAEADARRTALDALMDAS